MCYYIKIDRRQLLQSQEYVLNINDEHYYRSIKEDARAVVYIIIWIFSKLFHSFINYTCNWLTKVYGRWSGRLHVFLQIRWWEIISFWKHTCFKMINWVTKKVKFLLHVKINRNFEGSCVFVFVIIFSWLFHQLT